MEEMEQALQIDAYLRRNAGRQETEALAEIIAAKNTEYKQRKDRCDELLDEALRVAEIFSNGTMLDIRAKEPKSRISEAFRVLVEGKFTRLHHIDTPFDTVQQLRDKLLGKGEQTVLLDADAIPNRLAIEDVTGYVTLNSRSNLTVRTLLDNFGKSPYGWRDNDILGVLLTLFKQQEIRLEMSSQALSPDDNRVVDYVTKRDTNDRVVVKVRTRIAQDLINNAKDLARDVFSHTALPGDEDGIMAKFKDLARFELYQRKEREHDHEHDLSIKGLLAHYDAAAYPGKHVLEKGKKLLEDAVAISDVQAFFEALMASKDDLLDYDENVNDVRKFFVSKRAVFDKALAMIARYNRNEVYLLDENTKDVIGEIARITKSEKPYSEIQRLPELIERFSTYFTEILEKESVPIKASMLADREAVIHEYTKHNLSYDFSSRVTRVFGELIEKLKTTQDIRDIVAMKTESERIRERLIAEITSEAAKRAGEGPPDKVGEAIPNRIKKVKAAELFPENAKASTVAEIDTLVQTAKQKLVAKLDENTTIQIVSEVQES
jgi:hypothetical protein